MIWVEITYDDILENMPVDLRQVYDAFLGANPDKANRINEIVDNTIREFRDALKSAPNNIMDEREMWLPQSCVRHLSAIIYFELAMELGVNLTGAASSSKTSADVFLRALPFGRWVATTEADYAEPSPRFILPQKESYAGRALPALLSLIIGVLATSVGCGTPNTGNQELGSWVNPYAPGGAVNVGNVTVTNVFGDTYLTNIINNDVTVEGVVLTNLFEPSFSPTINNSNLISNGAFSGAVINVNITEVDPHFASSSNQFLKKSGGTMSGSLDMSNASIYFKPIPPDPRYSSGLFFSNSISTLGLVAYSNNFVLSRSFPFQSGGNRVWDSGNDGAGSGLDADLLDGLTSTQFVTRISGDELVFTNAGAGGTRVRLSGDQQTLLISNSWSGAELIDLRMRGSAGQTGIYIDDTAGSGSAQRFLDIRRLGVAEYIFTDSGIEFYSNKLSNVGTIRVVAQTEGFEPGLVLDRSGTTGPGNNPFTRPIAFVSHTGVGVLATNYLASQGSRLYHVINGPFGNPTDPLYDISTNKIFTQANLPYTEETNPELPQNYPSYEARWGAFWFSTNSYLSALGTYTQLFFVTLNPPTTNKVHP